MRKRYKSRTSKNAQTPTCDLSCPMRRFRDCSMDLSISDFLSCRVSNRRSKCSVACLSASCPFSFETNMKYYKRSPGICDTVCPCTSQDSQDNPKMYPIRHHLNVDSRCHRHCWPTEQIKNWKLSKLAWNLRKNCHLRSDHLISITTKMCFITLRLCFHRVCCCLWTIASTKKKTPQKKPFTQFVKIRSTVHTLT